MAVTTLRQPTREFEKSSSVGELWYTRCPVPTASGIALDLGLLRDEFAKSGIELKSIRDSEDPRVNISHFDHSLPGLFREGGNIPAIWARSEGRDTVTVALTWIDEYQAIVVRGDSSIHSLADLVGRKIGLPRQHGQRVDFARAMSLRGIETGLRVAGLSLEQVELVDVTSEQPVFVTGAGVANGRFHELESAALLRGDVDAIYVKGAPGLGSAKTHGLRSLINLGALEDPLLRVNNGNPRPVTVDRRTALERPDLVARYLAVLLQASHWAEGHASEVFEIIGKEVGRPAEEARAAYGSDVAHRFGLDLSDIRRRGLADQKDFLLRHGFITQDFDVGGWINPEPLALAHELLKQG
ncbi:ABC transporter substrate-binding protein [Tardiphaga sp.]|uniref:ABC transporter substrate-binding protein n=1 Tax=Tardiphaga sp. TaxID=1926292 RepID=UPI00352B53B4